MDNKEYHVPVVQPSAALGDLKYYSKIYGLGLAAVEIKSKTDKGRQSYYMVPVDTGDALVPGRDVKPDDEIMWSTTLPGQPVMSNVTFTGGTYKDLQGRSVTYPDIYFDAVVLTVNSSSVIQKTTIQGRDTGTVKEYIGAGDYMVEIRAVIASGVYGKYPKDEMRNLQKMLVAPIAKPVVSWYLAQFDIYHLVIESMNVEQVPGEYDMQRIVLQCCSDNPLIIKTAN